MRNTSVPSGRGAKWCPPHLQKATVTPRSKFPRRGHPSLHGQDVALILHVLHTSQVAAEPAGKVCPLAGLQPAYGAGGRTVTQEVQVREPGLRLAGKRDDHAAPVMGVICRWTQCSSSSRSMIRVSEAARRPKDCARSSAVFGPKRGWKRHRIWARLQPCSWPSSLKIGSAVNTASKKCVPQYCGHFPPPKTPPFLQTM